MKKYLVPIDFSAISENALKYACSLSRQNSAEVDLLYVDSLQDTESSSTSNVSQVKSGTIGRIKTDVQQYLNNFQAHYPELCVGLKMRSLYKIGRVSDEILKYCLTHPVNMVIMGTKGSREEGDASLMGSVTSEVIKNIRSRVLVIPKDAEFSPIERIVYCIDYEGYDKYTIDSLTAFAGSFNAEIIVLHINTEAQYFDSRRWVNFQRMVNDAYDYENMRFEFLNHENIIEGIDGYISENKVDILAMLTRNKHLIDRVFPKSITRKMVLHTEVPLLAFHE